MKLINPDYMTSSDDNFNNGAFQSIKAQKTAQNSHSLGNISALNNGLKTLSVATTDDIFLMRKKSRSREGINLGSHGIPISSDLKLKSAVDTVSDSAVIFTTARPAQVMPAAAANEKHTDAKLHIHEESAVKHSSYSTVKITSNGGSAKAMPANGAPASAKKSKDYDFFVPPRTLPINPDTKEVDWSSIVDTAITQINEGLKKQYHDDRHKASESPSHDSLSSTASSISSAGTSGSSRGHNLQQNSSETSLPELQSQVTQLEDRITKETKRRRSLETAVRKLTEENRRLQDESQAAVQQLRRFSEWFFQTIDRQN